MTDRFSGGAEYEVESEFLLIGFVGVKDVTIEEYGEFCAGLDQLYRYYLEATVYPERPRLVIRTVQAGSLWTKLIEILGTAGSVVNPANGLLKFGKFLHQLLSNGKKVRHPVGVDVAIDRLLAPFARVNGNINITVNVNGKRELEATVDSQIAKSANLLKRSIEADPQASLPRPAARRLEDEPESVQEFVGRVSWMTIGRFPSRDRVRVEAARNIVPVVFRNESDRKRVISPERLVTGFAARVLLTRRGERLISCEVVAVLGE